MGFKSIAAAIVLAAGAALLASCETMSAEECAAADWRALGFNDAAQNGADRSADRGESCAEKGLALDGAAYRAGFEEGMYQFCQPPNGFRFGRRGGAFNGYCPSELQRDFFAAFADGQRVHQVEADLEQARSRVSSLESRRRDIDDNIGSRERSLAEATTDSERSAHRAEIERLRRERRDVNDDIRTAQRVVPDMQRVLDSLRYDIGDRWGAW
jgi:hypothetical protein